MIAYNNFQENPQMAYYANQPMRANLPSVSNILFVADLPDECCEEDLSNFFKDYNFFFAKVIHNILRTHAFVHFQSREDAEKARNELNGVKLTPKYSTSKIAKPVRLCKYEMKSYLTDIDEKCNLLVKNLSKDVSAHMLFKTFRKYGDIRSSKLMIDLLGNSKGFGFVSFYKVEESIKAQAELDGKTLGGKAIKVNYLVKGRRQQAKKNNIYVKHFPKKNFENKNLEELFSKFGTIKSAIVLKDEKGESKGFGFVCFENPDDAEKALQEMNNKKVFDDSENNLYVSFAMKKGERQEQLLKKREEMFKLSQKMTIYSKIKDDTAVKDEQEFIEEINKVFKTLLSEDFKPKHIKVRFETKNAFITMNSQKEAEDFVKKYQTYSKSNNTVLYFNVYKSKIDRINASTYFKKYNAFSETASMASKNSKQYKVFNNFNQVEPQKKVYNNFDAQPKMPQPMYQTYNTFAPVESPQMLYPISKDTKIENKEDVGDIIYEIVENIYKEEAGKITGMLLEFNIEKLKKMILSDQKELKKQIDNAHELLQNAKK